MVNRQPEFAGRPHRGAPLVPAMCVKQRDLRQLLIHRDKLVEIRTRVKNGLQHLMLNRGVQKKRTLWSSSGQRALRQLPLEGRAARQRQHLLALLGSLNEQIEQLDGAAQAAAEQHPQARLLMTQPGVGPITALAFALTIGEASRFRGANRWPAIWH